MLLTECPYRLYGSSGREVSRLGRILVLVGVRSKAAGVLSLLELDLLALHGLIAVDGVPHLLDVWTGVRHREDIVFCRDGLDPDEVFPEAINR